MWFTKIEFQSFIKFRSGSKTGDWRAEKTVGKFMCVIYRHGFNRCIANST
jgi:hypothetical protein